jgi:hypothetical protein
MPTKKYGNRQIKRKEGGRRLSMRGDTSPFSIRLHEMLFN